MGIGDGTKYRALVELLRSYGRAAVAFSGGVDSALLLKAAHDALGEDVIALTGTSSLFPQRELDDARHLSESLGVEHAFVETSQLSDAGIVRNGPDRCYLCKGLMLSALLEAARDWGAETLLEGSNVDDEDDYRPGARAIAELGVESPLRRVGLTKCEIRCIAHDLGLPVWDKPSFACLATRFAFGDKLLPERLAMVDAAEQWLVDQGFGQVRVRVHGDAARVEVEKADIARLLDSDMGAEMAWRFSELGFSEVSVDPEGYRTGSMNSTLS